MTPIPFKTVTELENKIISQILRIIAVIGLAALIPSVYLSIKASLMIIVIVDIVGYIIVAAVAFLPKIPLNVKKITTLSLTYLVGAMLMIYTGPYGASTIYLFAFTFLAAIFTSAPLTIFANILSALTFTALSFLSHYKLISWDQDLGASLIIMANFILINVILSFSTLTLMKGFRARIIRLHNLQERLEAEVKEKEEEKRKVEQGLETKDILLRELHHRVKNNLQIISSLINLHLNRKRNYKAGLEGVRDRVRAISMVHRLLYTWEDEAAVKLEEILSSSLEVIRESVRMDNIAVEKDIKLGGLTLNADKATLISLILNEVLTNSVKYGFPDGRQGRILITMLTENDTLYIGVDDNGIGFDTEKERDEESLGLDLVRVIADQLSAAYKMFSSEHGTTLFLEIPLEDIRSALEQKDKSGRV